jgi:hypothetical protein
LFNRAVDQFGRFNGRFFRRFRFGFLWDSWHKTKLKSVGWLEFLFPMKGRQAFDGHNPEKFKMVFVNRAFEVMAPQHGKGNFAVNSRTR